MSENSMVLKEAVPTATPSGVALGLSASGVNILSPRPLASPQQAPVSRAIALTPARLVSSFVHRWPLAVLVGLIFAAGGAAIAWATYKPKYVAVAMLRLEKNESQIVATQNPHFHQHWDDEFLKYQTIMIRSSDLLSRVLERPSVSGLSTVRSQEDPLVWFEKELGASIVPGAHVIRVTLSGEVPSDLKTILDELVETHVKNVNDASKQKLVQDIADLNKVIGDNERRLADARAEAKRALERDAKSLDKGAAENLIQEAKDKSAWKDGLNRIEMDIADATAKKNTNQKLRAEIERAVVPQKLLEQALEQLPEIQNQLSAIAQIKSNRKARALFVKENDIVLKQIDKDIGDAEGRLEKTKLQLVPVCKAKITSDRIAELDRLDLEHDRTIDRLNSLKALYEGRLRSSGTKLPDSVTVDKDLEKAIADSERNLKEFGEKKSRIELQMNYARNERLSSNQTIRVPTVNQNSLVKSTAGFSIAGFFLGVLGICFLDARGQRVFKPVDVQRELGIETLGSFPRVIPNSKRIYGRKKEEAEQEFKQFISESSNRLCATLLCGDRLPQKPVLMVTSACANEGKTTVAAQLVRGFGRAGKKSLLVDCDVRNSRCHQMFGLPAGPGLSEVLRGEATLAEAVRPAASGQFSILTAGSSSGSLLQALSDGSFANILNLLREEYESIVIDTAPTLLVSEGLLIGKMVDGVLLVVRSKISKAPQVMAVYEQLTSVRIPVYGAIVNEYEPATYKQSYYRGND
jgi:succinoglycan biosynthesis transport protein ExoP